MNTTLGSNKRGGQTLEFIPPGWEAPVPYETDGDAVTCTGGLPALATGPEEAL